MEFASASNDRSDEELIRRVSRGDVEAFETLASRHQSRFVGIAAGILRDPDDAADVVQTAMLKIFSKAHTFKSDGSFSGWSGQIVRNEALMLLRRRKRLSETPLDLREMRGRADESHVPADQQLFEQRLRNSLARALETLPRKYRHPFELKMFDGLSVLEVADEIGLSEGGVKTRLYRARARLQQALLRQDAEIVRTVVAA